MTKEMDDFFEKYELVPNHIDENASWDGKMFETFAEQLDFVRSQHPNNIWTIVDIDYDGMAIIPGYHLVNREGYLITKEPWDDEDVEYVEYFDICFDDWDTIDLFEYLFDNNWIPDDSEFEDWKHDRTGMLDLCKGYREEQIVTFMNKNK
jgi:hypothetical protein